MSGTRLKTENETARAHRARKTLTQRFTDFFTGFEKKNPTVLQSRQNPLADSFAYSYHMSGKLRIDNVRRRYMPITSESFQGGLY